MACSLARDLPISSLKARPMRKKGGEVMQTRIGRYSTLTSSTKWQRAADVLGY